MKTAILVATREQAGALPGRRLPLACCARTGNNHRLKALAAQGYHLQPGRETLFASSPPGQSQPVAELDSGFILRLIDATQDLDPRLALCCEIQGYPLSPSDRLGWLDYPS